MSSTNKQQQQPAVATRQMKRKRSDKENHYNESSGEADDQTIFDDSQRNPTARMRFSARLKTMKGNNNNNNNNNSDTTTSTATVGETTPMTIPVLRSRPKSRKPVVPLKKPVSEMTEEEKKEDRARRNRASALKSRNKRRQRLAFLEVECKRLFERIRALENENAGLKCENSTLREQRDVAVSSPTMQVEKATRPLLITKANSLGSMPPPSSLRPISLAKEPKAALLPLDSLFDFSQVIDHATEEVGRALASSEAWTAADDAVLDLDWDGDEQLSIAPSPRFGCGPLKSMIGGRQSSFDRLISI